MCDNQPPLKTLDPFEQTLIPFTDGWFVSNLADIWPVVLEKKLKMRQGYEDNDNNNDYNDQVYWKQTKFDQNLKKLTWALSQMS